MSTPPLVSLDRTSCRKTLNRLRDGTPPLPDLVDYLSVGYEEHLARTRLGMAQAADGGYDITILEGPYGIGKSHLLGRVSVLAEEQGFTVKPVEVGSGGIYFNAPDVIAERIRGNDSAPYDFYRRGAYTVRKFVRQLNSLAWMYKYQRGSRGLVLLVDEMENTFDWSNLPRFPSRVKVYKVLDALFRGGILDEWGEDVLQHMYVMLAITPGVLEQAMAEPAGWQSANGWIENPARRWADEGLPDRCPVGPLAEDQAVRLAERIRQVHSVAFGWDADTYVTTETLRRLCGNWFSGGGMRDERQLVRAVVALLEAEEQSR